MDAKICDICGATYLTPITHHERIKDFNLKLNKFGWIRRILHRNPRYDIEKTYGLDICPACSDKICEFIDTLVERREDHETDGH